MFYYETRHVYQISYATQMASTVKYIEIYIAIFFFFSSMQIFFGMMCSVNLTSADVTCNCTNYIKYFPIRLIQYLSETTKGTY